MSISYFAECTVLITGASAGIGREFARQLAPVVSTMILAARRNDRLEALELELKVINPELELFCRPLDLRDQSELERFCDWLDESGLTIDLLVNNAGLGDHGPFADSEWEKIRSMLQVNVSALTYLTFRLLPAMIKAGCGAILNVSSVASLLPVPNSAVYAATKAYVTSLSEAIRAELRFSNISVTALCPGPVPTEFQARAGIAPGAFPSLLTRSAEQVAKEGYQGLKEGRLIVIPGFFNKMVPMLMRLAPPSLVLDRVHARQKGRQA